MEKTFRQCVIDYIQNRHLCKGYVDYIVAQLNKLDKIEQIMNASSYTENGKVYSYCYDNDTRVKHIKEVLERK